MFECWRRDGQPAHLSQWYGEGVGITVAHRSSSWDAQGKVSRFHSYVCTQHTGIRSFRHRFGAVVGTSHPAIGPFQMLCYHVLKDKLSGPEGHVEELVYFMWFPWWLYSYKREKKTPTSLFTEYQLETSPAQLSCRREELREGSSQKLWNRSFLCFVVPLKTLTPT